MYHDIVEADDVSGANSVAGEMQRQNMVGLDSIDLIEGIEHKRRGPKAGHASIGSDIDMEQLLNLVDKDV